MTRDQLAAASLIGSDFLAFPISNMGTGFGGTGGVAVARPRRRLEPRLRRERASLGAVRSVRRRRGGTERCTISRATSIGPRRRRSRVRHRARHLGLTYSTFGNDDLGGSVYNTGNRWLIAGRREQQPRPGQLSLAGWDLFRASGTLADGTTAGHENIATRLAGVRRSVLARRPSSSRTSKAASGRSPRAFRRARSRRSACAHSSR